MIVVKGGDGHCTDFYNSKVGSESRLPRESICFNISHDAFVVELEAQLPHGIPTKNQLLCLAASGHCLQSGHEFRNFIQIRIFALEKDALSLMVVDLDVTGV